MAERFIDPRASNNLANYLVGASEIPSELVNYTGKAMNRLLTGAGAYLGAGYIQPDEAIDLDNQISSLAEYIKPVKMLAPGFDEYLKQQSLAQEFRSGGQVAAGALIGGALPRVAQGVSLSKNSLANFWHSLKGVGGGAAVPTGIATAKGVAEESFIEPYLDGA
mgnify:CR=1 FL=1